MNVLTRATSLPTLITLVGLLLGCDGSNTYSIKSEIVEVDSLNEIILLHDSLVKPVLYTNINGLENLPFHQAKKTFISAILPSILVAKHHVHVTKSEITT